MESINSQRFHGHVKLKANNDIPIEEELSNDRNNKNRVGQIVNNQRNDDLQPEIREFISPPPSEEMVEGIRFRESQPESEEEEGKLIPKKNKQAQIETELRRSTRVKTPSLKALENINTNEDLEQDLEQVFITGELPESLLLEELNDKIPKNLTEAINNPEWKLAMKKELDSLEQNHTWTLVKLPADRKPVDSKWIYRIKEDENGQEVKKKARLVARGFSQKYRIDYNETYSPVMKMPTFRLLVALANKNSWIIKYGDFESAYLQSDIDEEIYL